MAPPLDARVKSAEGGGAVVGAGRVPGSASIFAPFPAWKLPRDERNKEGNAVSPNANRGVGRSLSPASSAHSVAPSLQLQQRPKRFNLRDGVQEAMECIKGRAEAKEMVVADALYDFHNSEISLHFLHALSAYFIRVAKDCAASEAGRAPERGKEDCRGNGARPPLAVTSPAPMLALGENGPDGNGGGVDGSSGDNSAAGERATLLREVGRSYGRVVIYCSNFEKTSSDAVFFESLLCLARMVVSTAVSEASLEPEIDKEFDRMFRGGVFHPTPVRPVPRTTRTRHSPALSAAVPPFRLSALGKGGLSSCGVPADQDNSGYKRSAVLGERGSPPNTAMVPSASARGTNKGPETTSEKSRKKRGPVSSGNPAFIPVSPLGSRDRQGEEHAAGGSCSGRRSNLTHKSHPGGRIVSSALTPPSSSPAGGIQNIDAIRSTGGQQVRDDGERPEVDDQIGESRAAEPTPAFDELSRWRLSRGSVPKMARLAVEVQRVALSNLAVAEAYRIGLATKFQRAASSAARARCAPSPGPSRGKVPSPMQSAAGGTSGDKAQSHHQKQQRETGSEDGQQLAGVRKTPSVGLASSRVSWKRRGRALTRGRRAHGGAQGADVGARDFFNAEALSASIASIIEQE